MQSIQFENVLQSFAEKGGALASAPDTAARLLSVEAGTRGLRVISPPDEAGKYLIFTDNLGQLEVFVLRLFQFTSTALTSLTPDMLNWKALGKLETLSTFRTWFYALYFALYRRPMSQFATL